MPLDFTNLEKTLGVEFKDKELLKKALTHRSYVNENPKDAEVHNERLEFLGDAVLELVVTEYLYAKFPEKPEGELTSLRAALVNAVILGDITNELGVNDFLLLSRGEAKDVGRARLTILANAFEAIVGAIYLDQGYLSSQSFIERVVLNHIDEVLEKKLYRDAKSLFQEEAQEKEGTTPTYKVLGESGPDHDKHFVVGVFLGEHMVAQGEGISKQTAQQVAAENALEVKGWS
jgi:ribonuclease III